MGHLCQYLEMVHSEVASSNSRRFNILVKRTPLDDPLVCSHGNRSTVIIIVTIVDRQFISQTKGDLSVSECFNIN